MNPLDQSFLIPLDTAVTSQHLRFPPFIAIDGTANVRDLGGLPASSHPWGPSRAGRSKTRSNTVLRSAQLSNLRPAGEEALQALGIKAIFDFRSTCEIEDYGAPLASLPGSQVYHVPIVLDDYFLPSEVERRETEYERDGEDALISEYKSFLEHGGKSFGAVFRYMIDHPNDAILVHCASKSQFSLRRLYRALISCSWKGQDRAVRCTPAYGLSPSSSVVTKCSSDAPACRRA